MLRSQLDVEEPCEEECGPSRGQRMTTLLQYFQIKTQRNVAIIEAKCPIPSSQWLDLRWDLGASGGQEERSALGAGFCIQRRGKWKKSDENGNLFNHLHNDIHA